ncbi:MAG: hypothetical protein ACKOXL_07560 [Limnohabitans sp.]
MSAQLDQLLTPRQLRECQAADAANAAALSATIVQATKPRTKPAPTIAELAPQLQDRAEALRDEIGRVWLKYPEEAPGLVHDVFSEACEHLEAVENRMNRLHLIAQWLEDGVGFDGLPAKVAVMKTAGEW